MSQRAQQITALRGDFTRSIAEAFDAACAIEQPAGTSSAWEAICARYQVALSSSQEREQIRAAQRPTRGAPIMELRDVVVAICKQVRPQLKRLDATLGSPEERRVWNELYRLIDRAERELVNLYKRHVLPPTTGGLFANVLAHAGTTGSAAASKGSANLLRCRHCGAPRMNENNDFMCEFCEQHMFEEQHWE